MQGGDIHFPRYALALLPVDIRIVTPECAVLLFELVAVVLRFRTLVAFGKEEISHETVFVYPAQEHAAGAIIFLQRDFPFALIVGERKIKSLIEHVHEVADRKGGFLHHRITLECPGKVYRGYAHVRDR